MPNSGVSHIRQLSEEMGHNSWRLPRNETVSVDWAAVRRNLHEALAYAERQDKKQIADSLEKVVKILDV